MAYRIYLLSSMVLAVNVSPAQDSRVDWYSLNSGSVTATSSALQVSSTMGESFVGMSGQGNSKVAAGFLAFSQLQFGPTSVSQDLPLPTTFTLYQNFPNPFNPATEIRFQIPEVSRVTLKVYDILGREVATLVNEVLEPGSYEVAWTPATMASGVYFYRIHAEEISHGKTTPFVDTRRLILLK